MKLLLVGNGAREHIIAEKLSNSAELYSAMSKNNPGIASLSKECFIGDISDGAKVAEWAKSKNIELAFVSPDAVLAAGVSDALQSVGIAIASPTKSAARIEWDKSYSRNLMQKHNIPGLPVFQVVSTQEAAARLIRDLDQVAIKPIGLTGGKGVRVSGDHFKNQNEAISYANEIISKDSQVLIEEKLEGEEFSLQLFSDGKNIALMPPVQDHKRAFRNDEGPNTGGMGSYTSGSLLPFMQESDLEEGKIISQKVIDAMREEENEFRGVLYTQGICTKNGVKIIEFNSRFGDPEAMNVLSILESDLTDIFKSISQGNLCPVEFSNECTVVKYLVPKGYPDLPISDSEIKVDQSAISGIGAKAYYASVYEKQGKLYTTSSRAIGLVGTSNRIETAQQTAENATRLVSGPLWHREDIGTPQLIQRRIEHMKILRS